MDWMALMDAEVQRLYKRGTLADVVWTASMAETAWLALEDLKVLLAWQGQLWMLKWRRVPCEQQLGQAAFFH